VAILSANYISARRGHYSTLYASANGHVAHESLDLRPLKDTSGVTPKTCQAADGLTLSCTDAQLPAPGTLMVEPTESESLAELDRLSTPWSPSARKSDRDRPLAAGQQPAEACLHTAASLPAPNGTVRPRETGALPMASLKA
jgi:glycine dehydrogenase